MANLDGGSLDTLTRVAWRQWTAIGVTGRIEPATAPVDPEALIILAARLGEQDARLRDAAIDWCVAAGHLVNGSRLTHIASGAGLGHVEVISSGERGRKVRLADGSPFRAWGRPAVPCMTGRNCSTWR